MTEKILEYKIEGPELARTIVFLHGWPDGPELWDSQVQFLSNSFRCVRITLPNFGKTKNKTGFDFPEVLEMLFQTIQKTQAHQTQPRVLLVGHDWGAYLSYLFERKHPQLVEKMVTLDVGGSLRPDTITEAAFYLSYQGWLITAWWIGKVWPGLANSMSRGLASLGRAPSPDRTSFEMNYFYFYLWRSLIFREHREGRLTDYEPSCPTLFIYGKSKAFKFHSKRWAERLNQKPDCRVEPLSRAGHWLMINQPEKTNELILKWFT